MYPKNAASPERILVGQVILIADGSVVTADALVRVAGQGGAWGAGGGTLACDATSGAWSYIPTQAETNFTSFMVQVYKAACIGCGVTVVPTVSSTPGTVDVKSIGGTAQTARDLGASVLLSVGTGAGQLNVSAGKAPATIGSGDAVGLPAAAAGAKGGIPITDAATGTILQGYGAATVQTDLVNAPNSTAIAAFKTGLAGLGVYLTGIMATALSETSGLLAAAFSKFFNKATPTGTINSLPDAVAGANGGLPTTNGTKVSQTVDVASDGISAAAISTAALNKLCRIANCTSDVNAAGTVQRWYDTQGNLVVTLTKTGTDPVTWTAVFAP